MEPPELCCKGLKGGGCGWRERGPELGHEWETGPPGGGDRKVGWPQGAILEDQSVGAWLPRGAAWVSQMAYPGATECLGSHWGCLLTE